MSTDLQFLEEWMPEKMDPGTVFLLENQAKLGHAQNPTSRSCLARAAELWGSSPAASSAKKKR